MKFLEIINIALFACLITFIGINEIIDLFYNKGEGFVKTILQHYDNFWNIFDGILIASSVAFIIIQIYCLFN